ncbi:MAG: class I SAM-dependent methyltransferase [Anaerolineales bacterium]
MSSQSRPRSNPFNERSLVADYESWYSSAGQRADRLEKALLATLLTHFPRSQTLLEIGCGTGHFTRWFEDQGLSVVGLDLSANMLVEARNLDLRRVILADAHVLPFPENSFDLAAFITTIEFLSSPSAALAEAGRVARRGLLLGLINAHSLLGFSYRHRKRPPWDSAEFYTVSELRNLLRTALGSDHNVKWSTTLWPAINTALPLPWGGFIGMATILDRR